MARKVGQNTDQHFMVKLGVAVGVTGTELDARKAGEDMAQVLHEAGFDVHFDYAVTPINSELVDVNGGIVPHCTAVTSNDRNTNPIAHTE